MMMTSEMRKYMLFLHVTPSMALLGAVGCFLLLSILGLASQDAPLIRACYVVLNPLTEWIILPLVITSLFVGMGSSIST